MTLPECDNLRQGGQIEGQPDRGRTMPPQNSDSPQLGRYFVLTQVGFEMVVPIAVGWWLDDKLGWSPWLTVTGVVLGLVLGFMHLVVVANRQDDSPPPGDKGP
jgi:hypothetical protein